MTSDHPQPSSVGRGAQPGTPGPIAWRCPWCDTVIRDRHYRSIALSAWLIPRVEAHLAGHVSAMTDTPTPASQRAT